MKETRFLGFPTGIGLCTAFDGACKKGEDSLLCHANDLVHSEGKVFATKPDKKRICKSLKLIKLIKHFVWY